MATEAAGWTLGELAQKLGGELSGPSDLIIRRPIPADGVDPEGLTFAESDEYLRKAAAGGAGAVLAPKGSVPIDKPTIFVDRPRDAFGMFLAMNVRPLPLDAGIHPTAVASPDAQVAIGETAASHAPAAFMEALAARDPRLRFDAWAHHPYPAHPGESPQLPESWPSKEVVA